MVSPRYINMIRDIGHLDNTYNKDIAQQYLSFNLTRKRVTVVMYLIVSILLVIAYDRSLSIHNRVSSLNLFIHLEIERIYI